MSTEPAPSEISEVINQFLSRIGEWGLGHVVNQLIGVSVQLEQAISDFLAVYLGRDRYAIDILGSHIIGQVSYDTKLSMLALILEKEELADEFPKLLPTATRIVFLRNQLAHSYPAGIGQQSGGNPVMYQREFRRRGVAKRVSLDVQEMIDLMEDAGSIIADQLPQLDLRYLPQFNDKPLSDEPNT